MNIPQTLCKSFSRIRCSCGCPRGGFTLIELVVVFFVIIAAAAILLPAFLQAGEEEAKTACINNLRKLGAVTATYLNDFDSWFYNRSFHIWGPTRDDRSPAKWQETLEGLYPEADRDRGGVFHCPAHEHYDPSRFNQQLSYGVLFFGVTSNFGLQKYDRMQLKLPQVTNPSRTVLIADSTRERDESVGRHKLKGSDFIRNGWWNHYSRSGEFAWRHGDTANVLFVDGSIKTLPSTDVGYDGIGYSYAHDLNEWARNEERNGGARSLGELDF